MKIIERAGQLSDKIAGRESLIPAENQLDFQIFNLIKRKLCG